MPTTLIFGGSGKVARALTPLLISHSHTVHSLIRNPDQAPSITALGAQPHVHSIEATSLADLTTTLTTLAPDNIVWAAGAGGGNPERTDAVDHRGAVLAMDAAAAAGVKRFVLVSALDVRDRSLGWPEWYDEPSKSRSDKVWGAIGPYMQAKLKADTELVRGNGKRGLEWTIVRPGGLTMDAGAGTVAAGKVSLERTVAREDVARVVLEVLANPGTVGLAFDVVGGETPVKEAVAQVARERVDTFAGRF